jgi:hypothetical protein
MRRRTLSQTAEVVLLLALLLLTGSSGAFNFIQTYTYIECPVEANCVGTLCDYHEKKFGRFCVVSLRRD